MLHSGHKWIVTNKIDFLVVPVIINSYILFKLGVVIEDIEV